MKNEEKKKKLLKGITLLGILFFFFWFFFFSLDKQRERKKHLSFLLLFLFFFSIHTARFSKILRIPEASAVTMNCSSMNLDFLFRVGKNAVAITVAACA